MHNAYKGTFDASQEKHLEDRAMLNEAVDNGHSLKNNKRGSGTKAAKENRYNAQKEIRKKQGGPSKGNDYDEFPCASTTQGGTGVYIKEVSSS